MRNSPSEVASALAPNPEYYPHTLDPITGQAYFVRLSQRQYEDASFLDERVLAPGQTGSWLSLDLAHAAVENVRENCHFIFHIGHVGSTLVSRLLGAMPGLFALREPTPLPALAHLRTELDRPESLWSKAEFEAHTDLFLKLWSRTFEPDQSVVIKATSWGSDLASTLLARPSRPRALFMAVQPEVYLAGAMASEGAWADIRNAAQSSLRRLHERLGETPWTLVDLSKGELAAMTWACEMTALGAARAEAGSRVMWIDFERFLDDPQAGLTAALEHLRRPADPATIAAVVNGPIMTRYSKMPEHRFDTAFRHRVLDDARAKNREEIARGLAWLDDAARRFPVIAAATGELKA